MNNILTGRQTEP